MKFKIPFTDQTLYLGKAAQAAKQSLVFGSWNNTFTDLVEGGGYRIGFETLYTIYDNVVDVNAAIKKKTRATAREGYRWVHVDDEDKDPDVAEMKLAEELINNNGMSFNKMKKSWVKDRNVAGNWYLHVEKNKSGKPLALAIVDPRPMIVVADQYGNVVKYIQQVWGKDPVEFDTDEMVHDIYDPSSKNPLLGASPIESIIWEAKGEMAAQMNNFFFYENNAVPAHLLITEEKLTTEQYKEIKKGMKKEYKGVKNRFKAGLIPFVKDIKTIVPSQKEMQYLETRTFTTKKVVVAFEMHSGLLGYTDKVQRGNMQEVRKDWYESSIRPDELAFEEAVKQVLKLAGITKIRMKVNPSNYENRRETSDIARNNVISGIITVNEARKQQGLEPTDHEMADELLMNGVMLDDINADLNEFTKEYINKVRAKAKYLDLEAKKMNNLLS
jgi:HK97 family phage portal protein